MARPVMAQAPPSLADIEALAQRALAGLPRQFKDSSDRW